LIIEPIVSLDLTLARWLGTKSLFLRFGADLAFVHSVLALTWPVCGRNASAL
jgi:hypothetical protein